MASICPDISNENVGEIGIIADKEQMLRLYPDAMCVISNLNMPRWNIVDGNKMLSFSFISEATAWQWALSRTNQFILNKLKG